MVAIAGVLTDRSGVPDLPDLPGVDVDVHVPTGDEVVDKVFPSVPGISVDFDPDLGDVLDKLKDVHDYFSPFGNDDVAQAMLKRVKADVLETQIVNEWRIKQRKEQKTRLLLGLLIGFAIGRSR